MNTKDPAQYVRAYFRINAGYEWGKGMPEEKTQAFFTEAVGMLSAIGFNEWKRWPQVPHDSGCPEGYRGAEYLYCHPMDLSGYVKESSVEEISKAIQNGKTFTVRTVDTFEKVFNFTPEEMQAYVEGYAEQIDEYILRAYTTKRSNLYRPYQDLKPVGRVWFTNGIGASNMDGIVNGFIRGRFIKLMGEGKIIESENRGMKIYRSAKFAQRKETSHAHTLG